VASREEDVLAGGRERRRAVGPPAISSHLRSRLVTDLPLELKLELELIVVKLNFQLEADLVPDGNSIVLSSALANLEVGISPGPRCRRGRSC